MANENTALPRADAGESRIKSGRRKHFTVLYKSAIEDKRLPLDARGLLAIMVGLPEGWQYSVKGLAAYVGVSKDTIRRLLGKLEDVGYLVREQSHDENGHFSGNVYVLLDEAPPLSENPDNGEVPLSGNTDDGKNRQREKPSSGFPTQINTKRIKDKKNQTPIVPADIAERVAAYCGDDTELRDALMGLLENRAKIDRKKAVKTERALNGILGRLDSISEGDRVIKIALLDKATTNNWLTVYQLKPDELPEAAAKSGDALPLGWGV